LIVWQHFGRPARRPRTASVARQSRRHGIPQTVLVPFFAKSIDDEKVFKSGQPLIDGLKLTLDELAKWTGALKSLQAG
jgi:hypothetical protein